MSTTNNTGVQALLIEGCDFEGFPIGGQLTMAKYLVKVFGDRLGVVGISTDATVVGRWIQKRIDGEKVWFFAVHQQDRSARRPLIPARLKCYWSFRRHRVAIQALGCRNVFLQSPESLFATSDWGWDSVCYCFPGTANPLTGSRYPAARRFDRIFDRKFLRVLQRTNLILVNADEKAYSELLHHYGSALDVDRVLQFPTRVDTEFYRPLAQSNCRASLGIPLGCPLLVSVGRLNRNKGWELLLQALACLHQRYSDSRLIFVGDGEDRSAMQARIEAMGLRSRVEITGVLGPDRIREYLNAADVFVCGSLIEGWSLAILEALACAKPIVTTRVSGATSLVREGVNGFVLDDRDPKTFARAIEAACLLGSAATVSRALAMRYSLATLSEDLCRAWPALRAEPIPGALQISVAPSHG